MSVFCRGNLLLQIVVYTCRRTSVYDLQLNLYAVRSIMVSDICALSRSALASRNVFIVSSINRPSRELSLPGKASVSGARQSVPADFTAAASLPSYAVALPHPSRRVFNIVDGV